MSESAANFRDILVEIGIFGVRCHHDTRIHFASPITALCGLNGTGKSTLLQLAATAYRPPSEASYNISDFMVVSALDPSPFADHAKVEFKFWTEARTGRTLTFSRRRSTRWRGYTRRRPRSVFLAGIGMYLPRTEQPSFVSRAGKLKISQSEDVVGRIRDWTCKILGHSYSRLVSHVLDIRDRRGGKISAVERGTIAYSEAHMGFGEARTIHIVSTLEALPEKSLVLLEEPETSLHLSAQHEFGRYLVDVAIHKKHQILLTTHSEFMLQALPSPSRVYLERDESGIRSIPGLTGTGKVFNVLGDVFPSNQLEKMIRDMYAHNQMDEELIKQRIIEQVDTKRLESITNSTLEGPNKSGPKQRSGCIEWRNRGSVELMMAVGKILVFLFLCIFGGFFRCGGDVAHGRLV